VRAVAAPAGLKGVLPATAALAEGFRQGGAEAVQFPVADGGEGTADLLFVALGGEWRRTTVSDPLGRPVEARWLVLADGTAVVEAAQAIGLGLVAPEERDPLKASSQGLGELMHAAIDDGADALLVGLGGTATVDGGRGLLALFGGFPLPVTVACDVRSPLLGPRGAARAFGRQKGADPTAVAELERRLAVRRDLAPYALLPGAGAAGGLGAALAALGAELVPGAELVMELTGFSLDGADLVVTGEGRVDTTTFEGKAPAAVLVAAEAAGVRGVIFGGVVDRVPAGVEARALSGDPARAPEDLVELGLALLGGA
jgi:glycerate kinase